MVILLVIVIVLLKIVGFPHFPFRKRNSYKTVIVIIMIANIY